MINSNDIDNEIILVHMYSKKNGPKKILYNVLYFHKLLLGKKGLFSLS